MRKIAKIFRENTNFTDAECGELVRRFLFLLAYPDANPLRRQLGETLNLASAAAAQSKHGNRVREQWP